MDTLYDKVIVVSKTQMRCEYCVGGILEDGSFVRLLKSDGHNQDTATIFTIGRWYDIEYRERLYKRPPHIEDILVLSAIPCETDSPINLRGFIKNRFPAKIWNGGAAILFDGKLKWSDSGSAYINSEAIPEHSVGFWMPNIDLRMKKFEDTGKTKYSYFDGRWYNIPYVGLQDPIPTIPAGTLLRVSLARWWQKDETTEERCYLQLSGWYFLC